MDEHDLPLDGWYRLAAVVVKGITDPTERERWRQWASDRQNPAQSPLRTAPLTDLWHGEPKRARRRCTVPMGRTSRTDFGKTTP